MDVRNQFVVPPSWDENPAENPLEGVKLTIIGTGGYSIVYHGRVNNADVGIKVLNKFSDNQDFLKSYNSEVRVLKEMDHKNIIKLYYNYIRRGEMYMILELSDCGSLDNLLHRDRDTKHYTSQHALTWLLDVSRGIHYLHSRPDVIIHRDVKPQNMLLFHSGRTVKLSDFGTASKTMVAMTHSTSGTSQYMAPEVFRGQKYSTPIDIFSLGITTWEILSRKRPFLNYQNNHAICWNVNMGARPPKIKGIPEVLNNLMQKCWDETDTSRPSIKQVISTLTNLLNVLAKTPLTPIPNLVRIPPSSELSSPNELPLPPRSRNGSRSPSRDESMNTLVNGSTLTQQAMNRMVDPEPVYIAAPDLDNIDRELGQGENFNVYGKNIEKQFRPVFPIKHEPKSMNMFNRHKKSVILLVKLMMHMQMIKEQEAEFVQFLENGEQLDLEKRIRIVNKEIENTRVTRDQTLSEIRHLREESNRRRSQGSLAEDFVWVNRQPRQS